MPKIDWNSIDGYKEDMSAEEKLALYEAYEMQIQEPTPNPISTPKLTTESKTPPAGGSTVSKAIYDKVASELATTKKQLRAKMSEDEQKEADRLANEEAMKKELETLRRERTLSTYKASYLSQGYDEALAEATATAMVDGDMDTVFANMKKYSDGMEKALRAKILKETPTPPPGEDLEGDAKKRKEVAAIREAMGLPPVK